MNFKKILTIALILATICITLTAISASNIETIEMGKITKGTVGISHSSGESDETYDFDIEVDISKLSDSDKKTLEDIIKDDGTVFVVNATSNTGKVTFSDYMGIDEAYINGNTLVIKNSLKLPYVGGSQDSYQIDTISLNTTDGVTYTAN